MSWCAGGWICGVQRRHRNAGGAGSGLGDAEQIGDWREAHGGAGRFLACRFSSGCGKWKWGIRPWGEANGQLVHTAATPEEAVLRFCESAKKLGEHDARTAARCSGVRQAAGIVAAADDVRAGTTRCGCACIFAGRGVLQQQFALIREAREWLRSGTRIGLWRVGRSGNLAGEDRRTRSGAGGGGISGRCFAAGNGSWLREQFREEAAKFPCLRRARRALADFRERWRRSGGAFCRTARSATMRRRAAKNSRQHRADARRRFRKR